VKRNGRALLMAACFLALILSAGCAALSPLTVEQEKEKLEERVKNYMQAQIDKKWDRVYSFFDSSYRAMVTREGYVAKPRHLAYTGFEIEEITVLPAGNQATVKVKINILVKGFDFRGAPQTQSWIKERGEWFVKPEPPSHRTPFGPPQEKQK
jgi:hypothetical protein